MHKFRNETGSEVPKYGVFKIGDPVITPTDNLNQWLRIQSFEGLTPTADCDFAITQEAYKSTADALKPCVVDGTTPVTIDVTDEAHTHAKAGTTVDKLVSDSSGPAKIVWKESGTGDKKALIHLGIAGAAGGDTVDAMANDPTASIASRTTSFSTTGTETKQIGIGGINPTRTTNTDAFGSYRIKLAGTYFVEWNLEVVLNSTDQGSSGTVATGVPEAPELPIHLVTSGALRIRGYLYDSGGAYTDGTILDEKNCGSRWQLLPNDDTFFSDPNFDSGERYHIKVSELFSLTQTTLDSLTNNEALLYLEGQLIKATGTFGTSTASVITSFSCLRIDKQMNSGGEIDITAYVAP